MSTNLFVTVGTSLLSNMRRPGAPAPLVALLESAQAPGNAAAGCRALGEAFASDEWPDKLVPAEIASVRAMQRVGLLPQGVLEVCFAVSATRDGELVGAVLVAWAEACGWRGRVEVVAGLDPGAPQVFASVGLRNLVRAIGDMVRRVGGAQFLSIVATGGFKAQMATATLVGQALGITVHYLHEGFSHIIAFPPLAVSFDFAPLLGNYGLVLALEEDGVLELPDAQVPEELLAFLEHTAGDAPGISVWALAPVGQIYLEAFRQRYPPARSMPPGAEQRKAPTFRDDHFPQGFEAYVRRVWELTPQLKSGHTIEYVRQRSIRDRAFYWRDAETLVAEYRDKNGFGARMAFLTTAEHEGQRLALLVDLHARFGQA